MSTSSAKSHQRGITLSVSDEDYDLYYRVAKAKGTEFARMVSDYVYAEAQRNGMIPARYRCGVRVFSVPEMSRATGLRFADVRVGLLELEYASKYEARRNDRGYTRAQFENVARVLESVIDDSLLAPEVAVAAELLADV